MELSLANRYWTQFLNSRTYGTTVPSAYCDLIRFGDDEEATAIARLALDGIKTTTGSLLWQYQYDQKPLPSPGDYNVLIDSGFVPVGILQTTEVNIVPFDQVSASFAYDGGEGDRTLSTWKALYWDYIQIECSRIGKVPDEKTPIVCERFRLVYCEPLITV